MRRSFVITILSALALAAPSGARASQWDYSWALPEWRATWSLPRLADNRGFAVRTTADAIYTVGVAGSAGQGAGDLVVLKYGLDGSLRWVRNWGGFELDQAQGLAVTEDAVWIAGSHTSSDGTIQFALVRVSGEGEIEFANTWSRGVADQLQAIALHGGHIYVAGLTQPSRAKREAYVARLDAAGTIEWEKSFASAGWAEAWDVAVDDGGVWVGGYVTPATDEQAFLVHLDHDGGFVADTQWGGAGNDEARAIALDSDAIWVTGGQQMGRSTDVFVARYGRDLRQDFSKTTGGSVVGGGGYGISVGARGVYVAGGTYDFPAGGDGAVMRFSRDGALTWTQFYGLPGFWDWGFDVDARDGYFTTAGVLWRPGAEWYQVLTLRYREDFPTQTLTGALARAAAGDVDGARAALEHFYFADFQRWAQRRDASNPGTSRAQWEGASDAGRRYGRMWVDTTQNPPAGEQDSVAAFTGLSDDVRNGNYAFVRDYSGVTASFFDGFIRIRYFISHDRLIPQGGYLYIGDFGIPLPPPPV